MKTKRIFAILLIAALILTSMNFPAMAATSPSIQVGSASFSSGEQYFPNLTVSGTGIRTLLISFSEEITSGDKIILPTASTGFTVSSSSLTNNYVKRINLDSGITSDAIQSYLRQVKYQLGGDTQSVDIVATQDIIQNDTYYNSSTKHYYQYIADTSSSWTTAYNTAKSMSYMGRSGYLATITSLDEDTFVNTLSAGKTGWLGGTIMKNSGSKVDATGTVTGSLLYYSALDTSGVVPTGWYWACGPEIGTTFYNTNTLFPNANETNATTVDGTNTTYYNWARGHVSFEPNNQTENVSDMSGDFETCLTTLKVTDNTGKQGTSFSWNDKHYLGAGTTTWDAKGYFVEYGDLAEGDSGSGSLSFASDSGTLSANPTLTAGEVCRTSTQTGTVKFTSDRSGAYYYALVPQGGEEPLVDTSGAGTSCIAGENTITNPTGLVAGSMDMYVKVKDASGNVSSALKIGVDAYAGVELTTVTWQNSTTYTCGLQLPSDAKMVTVSVDTGTFTVPSLGSNALTFLGGTNGSSYLKTYSAGTAYDSVVFSFTDVSEAQTLLSNIIYSTEGSTPQTISASSSSVAPTGSDIYFEGHYYRYVAGNIDWQSAVLAAGGTSDPYFGGRGYIATATSQIENSILLRLTDTGASGSDHWNDAWMGGLWQRNTGSVTTPNIVRAIDGHEISYTNLLSATADQRKLLLPDYSLTFSDFVSNNSSTYINAKTDVVKYYWIDGPEAGQEIAYNVDGFSPWHSGEPNSGDFVYIGWEGAYWDDLSAYSSDNTAAGFAKLSGYIVEFSGFDGGTTADIVKEDTKTTTADTTAPTLTAGDVTRTSNTEGTVKFTSDESGKYYYTVVADGSSTPTIDTSGEGTTCISGENTIINPTGLNTGAKEIYIQEKDARGNLSNTIKIEIPAYNTLPTFIDTTQSITVEANSVNNDIAQLLHVNDSDSSQTLTWSQNVAPNHGTLGFSDATATSGSSNIGPNGTITYTPTTNYAGTDSFSVQVSDGAATATCTISVTINDTTAPTATITLGTNHWTSFLNTITFGLYYKETQSVSIATDDQGGSGIKAVEYYKSSDALTAEEIQSLTQWSSYSGPFSLTAADAEKYVIYAKVTDNGGNITVISSDGLVFDLQGPSISTNYTKDATSMEVTVTDSGSGVDQVTYTVNSGTEETPSLSSGKFTVSSLSEGSYDVVVTAKDKIGNESTLTIPVISLHTVTFHLFDGDTEPPLKTETVEYGNGATAPSDPNRTGFAFTGWDTEFDNITQDTQINGTWDISDVTVTPYSGIFDGTAHDAVTVTGTFSGDTITYSTDGIHYSIDCPQIKDAGDATVYVKVERSGYASWNSKPTTATIYKKEITADMIAAIPATKYTGLPLSPLPEVKFDTTTLEKDVDYTVTYSHNTDVGLATVTISGTGNYAGFVDVSFPIYAMSTNVLIGDEKTPQAVVDGLDALYGDKNVYTEEDQKIEQNGGSVNLALSVQTKSYTGADQKKIQELAQNKVIGIYLDISLYKTVTFSGKVSGTTTKINQISEPLTITIPLPDEMNNKTGIALYRVHEGVATIIPIGKENAVNGEYCTIDDENITLYVSNFSTYAIGYDKAKDNSENIISNPDTSDDTPTLPFIAFGICGFITVIILRKGKKPHKSL